MHTSVFPPGGVRPAAGARGERPPSETAPPPAPPVPYSTSIRELPSEERPRERLLALGAGSLTNTELIAILLRTGVRGENVLSLAVRLAHLAQERLCVVLLSTKQEVFAVRLLTTCCGLRGLLQASVAEICTLRGVNEAKAALVVAALELGRRAANTALSRCLTRSCVAPEDRALIRSPEDIYNLIGAELAHLAQERLCVVLLSTKQEVLRVHHVYQGTVNSASVRIAEVLRPAIKENCPHFIVVLAVQGELPPLHRRAQPPVGRSHPQPGRHPHHPPPGRERGHHGHRPAGPPGNRCPRLRQHEAARPGLRRIRPCLAPRRRLTPSLTFLQDLVG